MNTELAVRFGRKVRDLIADPVYTEIFPDTDLKQDSQAAGRWETSQGGEYFAAGVGAAMTGRGADLLIIDDPHSEQDALCRLLMIIHTSGTHRVRDRDYNMGEPSSLCKQDGQRRTSRAD